MIKVRATKIINNQQNRKLNPTPLKRNINKVSNSIRKKFNIAYQYWLILPTQCRKWTAVFGVWQVKQISLLSHEEWKWLALSSFSPSHILSAHVMGWSLGSGVRWEPILYAKGRVGRETMQEMCSWVSAKGRRSLHPQGWQRMSEWQLQRQVRVYWTGPGGLKGGGGPWGT
jgi:hypothetical protein